MEPVSTRGLNFGAQIWDKKKICVLLLEDEALMPKLSGVVWNHMMMF